MKEYVIIRFPVREELWRMPLAYWCGDSEYFQDQSNWIQTQLIKSSLQCVVFTIGYERLVQTPIYPHKQLTERISIPAILFRENGGNFTIY